MLYGGLRNVYNCGYAIESRVLSYVINISTTAVVHLVSSGTSIGFDLPKEQSICNLVVCNVPHRSLD